MKVTITVDDTASSPPGAVEMSTTMSAPDQLPPAGPHLSAGPAPTHPVAAATTGLGAASEGTASAGGAISAGEAPSGRPTS